MYNIYFLMNIFLLASQKNKDGKVVWPVFNKVKQKNQEISKQCSVWFK